MGWKVHGYIIIRGYNICFTSDRASEFENCLGMINTSL